MLTSIYLPMQATAGAAPSPLIQLAPMVLIFFIFYFFIIRPQQNRQKELNKLIQNVKKGDKIVTSGGIIGVVTSLQQDYVVITTGNSDQTKMEVLKSAITGIRGEQQNG